MAEAVMKMFDEFADTYSDHFSSRPSGRTYSFRKRLRLACEMTAHVSGRMLDCATGTGEVTLALVRTGRFQHASVIDISPRMLAAAEKMILGRVGGINLDFHNNDVFAYDLPADAPKYQLIVCLGLIAHTGRIEELLAHLKTMLANDGAILLQSSLDDHLGNRLVKALTARKYAERFGYSVRYFRHRDIVRAAEATGLQVADRRKFQVGIPFGDRIWARGNYAIETRFEPWAAHHGADALYVLTGSEASS